MALASCQCNKAGLRMPCAQEGGGFVCGRCGLRISQTHVAAYPECAEKDAEIERLKAQVASGLPTQTSSSTDDQLAAIAKLKGGRT